MHASCSEKINVETTLTSNYNTVRWDRDCGKFSRYKQKRRLCRLLIVTHSNKISREVLNLLNKTRDPIGLIEFGDLKSIHQHFIKNRDYAAVVSKLSQPGKIAIPSSLTEFRLFATRQLNITRTI